jgi:hypothetical protein
MDYSIRHLATTSDWRSWGDAHNWQFLVWTVADPNLVVVFAMPAPPNGLAQAQSDYSPYRAASSAWIVGSQASDYLIIEELAVVRTMMHAYSMHIYYYYYYYYAKTSYFVAPRRPR